MFYLAPVPVPAPKVSICRLLLLCFRRKRWWYYKVKKKIWKPSVCSPTKHFGLHGIEITQNRISTEYPSLLFKELSSLALNKAQEGGETFVAGCSWANWSNKGSIQLTLCISHTHTETSANSIEKAETVRKFHLANLVIMKFDFRFLLLERDGEKTPGKKERQEKVENLHNRIYSFSKSWGPEDRGETDGRRTRTTGWWVSGWSFLLNPRHLELCL